MQPLPRVTDATLDVLEVLLSLDDDLYGYKIAVEAGRKTGVVYPILDRLENAGWVESAWEREERGDRGPRRRFYHLKGDACLAADELLRERRGAARPSRRRAARPGPPIVTFLSAWPKR
jgi:PadR family transcriptional regulator PadR